MVAITFDPEPLTTSGGSTARALPVDDLRYGADGTRPAPVAQRRPLAVIMAGLATVIVAVAFGYLAMTPELAEPGTVPVADAGYTAVDGDTMWSIARDQGPAGQTGAYVERLVEVNGTATVVAGQHIDLPRD